MILANGCNITKSEKFKGGLNTFRTHCILPSNYELVPDAASEIWLHTTFFVFPYSFIV